MKKKKNSKRLPKYALGTMKPIDLGYLPGRGIGTANFTTEYGTSLQPEIDAMRANRVPQALSKILTYSPYITNMVKSFGTSSTTAPTIGAVKAAGNNTTNLATSTVAQADKIASTVPLMTLPNFVGDATQAAANTTSTITPMFGKNFAQLLFEHGGIGVLTAGTAASTGTNGLFGSVSSMTKNALSATKDTAKQLIESGTKSGANAGKSALGTASKALGVVGSAYGLTNMGMDIADFGSHRESGDMLTNMGRNFYTTEYGNQYLNYTGPNVGQEISLENASAKNKQLGFAMDAIGTGASIGGLFGPLGMGIGALAGGLLGGIGSLFGWGDNTEEVERAAKQLSDNVAVYNKQQRAVAQSKDVAAEFNDRQGVATAAVGKNAFGPMTSKEGDNINTPRFVFDISKPNNIGIDVPSSKLMPGETVVNKEDLSQWAVVPGKGNKDNVYSTVAPGDSNVVLTNKEGISKLGAAVLKSNAPESLKRWLINELEKRQLALLEQENQTKMKKYKNGKLPGFWKGTDYLMSAIPHLAALGSSWNLYNRAKYADMPDYPNIVDSSANTEAINILGRRKYNVDPILDNIHKNYRQYLYNVSHSGASAGQQAIERANAFIKKNEAQTQALTQADEINNKYTADYANAFANYGKWMSEMMTNNNYARAAFRQQLNAAKEGWMAQYEKNGLMALADLASDIMGVRQFNRSEDFQNKILKLYGQQVKNDKTNAEAALAAAQQAYLDRLEAYRNAVKESAEKANPVFANYGLFRPNSLWNMYGALDPIQLSAPRISYYSWMKRPSEFKDGKEAFVDTRSDTTTQGYHEGYIPVGAGNGPAGQGPLALLEGLEEISHVGVNNPFLYTGEAPTPSKSWADIRKILAERKAASIAKNAAKAKPSSSIKGPIDPFYGGLKRSEIRAIDKLNREKKKMLVLGSKDALKLNPAKKVPGYTNKAGTKTYNWGAITANDLDW